MKLIRPLDGLRGLASSDAPMDPVEQWTPEGRDLLSYLIKPIFSISGNTMVAVSEAGGELYKQDLVTGVTSKVEHAVVGPVHNLSISPDALLLCVVSSSSGDYKVEFLQALDGQVKYAGTRGARANDASTLGGASRDGVQWASDSTSAYFAEGSAVRSIDTVTWVASTIFDVGAIAPSDISANDPENWTDVYGGSVNSLLSAAGSLYVSGSVYGEIDVGLASKFNAERGFTLKMNAAGAVFVYSIYTLSSYVVPWLRWNPARSEIMAFQTGGILPLNPSNLAPLPRDAAPESGIYLDSPQSIKTTATQIISRSQSTTPYWNYRLLTDYSLDKSLPALPERGEGVAAATDYTAVQQSQGIALFDSTDTLVAQQNPNVTAGDTFIYLDHVYEALTNNNDRPDLGALAEVPTWEDMGFINPLRMFDGRVGTYTEAGGDLVITISSNTLIDGLAMFGVSASAVQVQVLDGAAVIFDTGAASLRDSSSIDGWYSYFFRRRGVKSDYVLTALPPYRGATIRIVLSALDGKTRLGDLVAGQVRKIGDLLYGVKVGVISFSRKERDAFGVFDIVKRDGSKRSEYPISIRTSQIAWIQELLAGLDATPIAYIGDEDRRETIVYGLYRGFDITLEGPVYSDCSIEVEGLI